MKRLQLFVATCLLITLSTPSGLAEELDVWAEVEKLTAPTGRFGFAVSIDGNQLAANGPGSPVYLFELADDGTWRPSAALTPLDNEQLSAALSLDDQRLAVAAQGAANYTGAVYLFERVLGEWTEVAKVTAPDGDRRDYFGVSVALEGDLLVVGSHNDDGDEERAGSVYVFERTEDGLWPQVAKLTALDGGKGDNLGLSVSLSGNFLVAGASRHDPDGVANAGAAYVFEQSGDGRWAQAAKLTSSDGQPNAEFGSSVAIDQDRIAVAASRLGIEWDSVRLFERNGSGEWLPAAVLEANPEDVSVDSFGQAVSMSGDRIAVGGRGTDSGRWPGVAFVFDLAASGEWLLSAKVSALDGHGFNRFGDAISLSSDVVAVGAWGDDEGSGAVYILEPVLVSPELDVSGSCPGTLTLTNTGSTPRSRVGIYGSGVLGSSNPSGGPCVETLLELEDPTSLRLDASDFDGAGTVTRTVDESWCGTYIQVLDERTCLPSDVAQIPESQ